VSTTSLRSSLTIISEALGSESAARTVLRTLRESGYACVPREPTKEMLEDGWYYAHEEDALGTWRVMIEKGDV
jgi:hypothetical protein